MKKCLVLMEPSMSGHKPSYIRRIVDQALDEGYRVKVVTSESSREHTELADINLKYRENAAYSVHFFEDPKTAHAKLPRLLALFLNEWYHCKWYQAVGDSTTIVSATDLKFVLTLDNAINIIGLFGSPFRKGVWSGILMRQTFHYETMEIDGPKPGLLLKIKRMLFLRALANCRQCKFFTIDPSLYRYLTRENTTRHSGRIDLLPDPVDPIDESESMILDGSIPFCSEDHIILVFGSLRKAKGVESLLRILPVCKPTVKLVLAGKQHDEVALAIESLIASHPECRDRIYQLNRYINKSEEKILFSSATVVWLGYVGHFGMSGVLIQAAMYEKPVIATNQGLIGWYTREYQLGYLCNPQDDQSVVTALEKSITDKDSSNMGFNFKEAVDRHSLQNFHEALFSGLEELRTA